MTRARIIFYSVFGFYNLAAVILTVWMDTTNSTYNLLGMLKYMWLFKYLTLFGLLMVIADFVWLWIDQRNHRKAEEAWRHENNILKAKVYDFQEEAKIKPEVPRDI